MVLDNHTLSNGTGPRDTTCDSRHERTGVDTYLGYREPPQGRVGLRECLVSPGTLFMMIGPEAGPRGDATVRSSCVSTGNLGVDA